MTFDEILSNYWREGLLGVLILSGLVQVSPLKINPWTWLARKIGKGVNGEVLEKVGEIDKRLTAHIKADEEEGAMNKRSRILIFADDIRRGQNHTKEHYENVLLDIDAYSAYCESHEGFVNSKTVHATRLIMESYDTRLRNNSFLE